MTYTSHGHWIGPGEPSIPRPLMARCGGPAVCTQCRIEAIDAMTTWLSHVDRPHDTPTGDRMQKIRAKFLCQSETRSAWGAEGSRTYEFQAVYDQDLPEDQRFAKATPSGSVKICVDNPSAQFELGAYYYLDFTPVGEADA